MPGRAQHHQHGAPCSPQDVLGMAHFYAIDIDQKDEYWLLAIALEARLAPVEEPYVEEVQTDGRLLYVDKRSGEKSELHPLDTQFSALMRSWRAKGAPEDNATRTCMCFTDQQGSQYYYDFTAAARLTTPPTAHTLIALMATLDVPTYRAEQALPNTPRRAEVMLQDKPDVQVLRVSDKSDKSEDRAQHRQDAERRAYLRTLTETQRAGLRHSAAAAPAKGPKKALQWLTFHSSWYEDCESKDLLFRDNGEVIGGGIAPRHAILRMSLETNAFDVTLRASRPDEPEVTLTGLQSVTTTAGMPVQPWDMHVGAVLETLGKFIVLRSCSAETGLWLSKKARLVIALKEELLVEFRKYNQDSFAPAMLNTRGVGGGRLAHSYTEGIELQAQARVAIQAVADQVVRMAELLHPYRPTIASRYQAQLRTLRGERQNRLPSSSTIASAASMLRSHSQVPRTMSLVPHRSFSTSPGTTNSLSGSLAFAPSRTSTLSPSRIARSPTAAHRPHAA